MSHHTQNNPLVDTETYVPYLTSETTLIYEIRSFKCYPAERFIRMIIAFCHLFFFFFFFFFFIRKYMYIKCKKKERKEIAITTLRKYFLTIIYK